MNAIFKAAASVTTPQHEFDHARNGDDLTGYHVSMSAKRGAYGGASSGIQTLEHTSRPSCGGSYAMFDTVESEFTTQGPRKRESRCRSHPTLRICSKAKTNRAYMREVSRIHM